MGKIWWNNSDISECTIDHEMYSLISTSNNMLNVLIHMPQYQTKTQIM
jgi:hypothetical protein